MRHEDDRIARVRVAREGARLLQDHRERSGPPPGAAEAAWQAIGRRIAAGEADPLGEADEDEAPAPGPRAASGRRWAAVAVALAAGVLLWQLAPRLAGQRDAAGGHAASDLQPVAPARSASEREHGREDRREGSSGQVLKDMLQRTDAESLPARPGEPDGAPRGDGRGERAAVPGDSREPAAPAAADLARELALLRGAAEALRAGQAAEALAQAETYLQAHPAGAFVPEARLHRAQALCLLGRVDEARAAGAAFQRDLPESPLRARVAAVCAP